MSDVWLRDQRSMKTDGIYRYRLENPPPKRVVKWWEEGTRFGVRLGWAYSRPSSSRNPSGGASTGGCEGRSS